MTEQMENGTALKQRHVIDTCIPHKMTSSRLNLRRFNRPL